MLLKLQKQRKHLACNKEHKNKSAKLTHFWKPLLIRRYLSQLGDLFRHFKMHIVCGLHVCTSGLWHSPIFTILIIVKGHLRTGSHLCFQLVWWFSYTWTILAKRFYSYYQGKFIWGYKFNWHQLYVPITTYYYENFTWSRVLNLNCISHSLHVSLTQGALTLYWKNKTQTTFLLLSLSYTL